MKTHDAHSWLNAHGKATGWFTRGNYRSNLEVSFIWTVMDYRMDLNLRKPNLCCLLVSFLPFYL